MKISACCTPVLKSLAYMVVITGLIFLSLATWLLVFKGYFILLIHDQSYTYCIFIVIACGVLHIITGFLINSIFHSRCALFFYILIILIAITLDCALGYFTMLYENKASQDLENSLKNDMVTKYNDDSMISYAIDNLQKNGKCCGSRAFNDYPDTNEPKKYDEYPRKRIQYIPDSCCRSFSKTCALSDNPSNIYYIGCLTYFQKEVHHNLKFISILTSASLIILLLTFFASFTACCRSRPKDRNQNEVRNTNLLTSKSREQELFLLN